MIKGSEFLYNKVIQYIFLFIFKKGNQENVRVTFNRN